MPCIRTLLFCLIVASTTACSGDASTAAAVPTLAHDDHDGRHDQAASLPSADDDHEAAGPDAHGDETDAGEADVVHLTDAQIAAAGIEVSAVREGMAGALTVPALIAADADKSAVVAAAVGGRIMSLARNLGDPVHAGDTLAIIESREVAELQAEIAAAREQRKVTQATLEREERLFDEKVSPEQDVLQARAAAAEARIRMQLAEQRLGATGVGGDALNRIAVRSPLAGHVVGRDVELGQVVRADAELFRVADLSTVWVELALPPDAAAGASAGRAVWVRAHGREAQARIAFVSPIVDPHSRQVRAIATLPNKAGQWRVGESVQAAIELVSQGSGAGLAVPKSALQTMEDKPSVFVRVAEGFKVKQVQLGAPSGDDVMVADGLEAGDRIAITNTYVLKAEAGKGEGEGE